MSESQKKTLVKPAQPLYALANPDAKINAIIVYNPFDLSKREKVELQWGYKRTLAEYLTGLPEDIHWGVCVNADVVDKENWSDVCLNPDDFITLTPLPAGGGGGGKNVLRLVAMIAVVAFAAYAAPLLAGAMGFTTAAGLGAATAAIAATITTVGGLLVNALLPLPKPSVKGFEFGSDLESPTYGVDGAKNTATEDVPVPIVYGAYRVGGNIVNLKTQNSGDSQWLYIMTVLSEGPIESISDIELNNEPLKNFSNYEIETRLGVPDQTRVSWFSDSEISFNKGTKITTDWTNYTTTGEVDKLRLDMVFPSGLCRTNAKSGKRENAGVGFEIQYRKVGAASWINYSPAISVAAATRVTLRRSFTTPVLGEGYYDVRIRRTSTPSTDDLLQDSVILTDIWEIISDDVNYNNTAYLALKIKLTDQLNNIPKITALVKGRKLVIYDRKGNYVEEKYSNNPAWIAVDILTNSRYGGSMNPSRLDFSRLYDIAEHCEEKGFLFNGVFDSATNVWESLQDVLRVAHAQIIAVGTRYSFALEKADDPVMMFGVGNIIEDSFSLEWLALEDRANDIEVSYYDETDSYNRKSVKIYDGKALDKGVPVRTASVSLMGVTNAQQAIREGWFRLALNRYIIQSVTFDAPLEAIACTVGDLVFVQHDMPKWGEAGRMEAGSSDLSLKLDRPVEMLVNRDYRVLVQFDAVKRYSGIVRNTVGNSAFVSGLPGGVLDRVKRMKTGTADRQIMGIVAGSPYAEIMLDGMDGVVIGAAFELWDTDVLEERAVVNEANAVGEAVNISEITLTSKVSSAPAQFSNWMFGETAKFKKPFRVISIRGSDDDKRTLSCTEYNASVYDDPENAVATPNYSGLTTIVGQATDLACYEELFLSGSAVRTRLIVEWDIPDGSLHDGADIYVSINGRAYENVATIRGGATSFSYEVTEQDKVSVKIVAIDGNGGKASYSKAPIITRTIVGKAAPPSDVRNFMVEKSFDGILFSWDAVSDLDLLGYEIRQGKSWDDGAVVVQKYAGNTLTVAEIPSGIFTWFIRAIDTSGKYSETPASFSLVVTVPATVKGFDVVQNQNIILFVWTANAEPDVVAYEIREGVSWGSSVCIATGLTGTRHSIPSNTPSNRQFWIKAIDRAKLYSTEAAGALALFTPTEDYNIILVRNEQTRGWDGLKENMHVATDGRLLLNDDSNRGEYYHEMVLPDTAYARNVVTYSLDAVVQDSRPWKTAAFAWKSDEAQRPWLQTGSIDSMNAETYVSYYRGLQAGEVDALPLNGDNKSLKGVIPTIKGSVSWGNGRFGKGINFNDTSVGTNQAWWNIAFPTTFRVSSWIRMGDATRNARLLLFTNLLNGNSGLGNWLNLNYLGDGKSFQLFAVDNSGITLTFPVSNADLLFAVVVKTTNRLKLFLGKKNSAEFVSGEFAYSGAATGFKSFVVTGPY